LATKGKESFAQRLIDWFTGHELDPRADDATVILGRTPEDETTPVAVAPPLVPDSKVVPPKRYEIIKSLGKGAYGVVSLGRDLRIGRLLAVKQLNAKFTRGTDIHRRFLQEARIAGQLDNPNIVTIYDVEDGEVPCILMEYLSGGNLESLIRLDAPMNEMEALGFLRGIMNGLRAAHGMGVVHRDIKPSNIIFDQNGTPKISDFGVAMVPVEVGGIDDPRKRKVMVVGTPDYMAPEQMEPDKRAVDDRADLYSCGLLFYEMLTGERYHQFGKIRSAKELTKLVDGLTLPGDSDFPEDVSEGARELVRNLIRKNPGLRLPNAQAVMDVIDELIAKHSGLEDLNKPDTEEPTVRREMFEDILRLFLVDGVISAPERRELTIRSKRLGLIPEEALELEEKIRKEFNLPSLRHLQEYAWRVERLLEDREFSEEDQYILDELGKAYNISEDERQKIQNSVMVKFQMKEGVVEDLIP